MGDIHTANAIELGLDLSQEILDLTMQQCEDMGVLLSDQIEDHCIRTGEQFDLLGVIPRGSFGPANVVSRRLGFSAITIVSASLGSYPEGLTEAVEMNNGQLFTGEHIEGADILVVDDTSDTDNTLEEFRKIAFKLGAKSVKSAVFVYKPGRNKTGKTADFYVVEYDGWVNFYWEKHDKIGKQSVAVRRIEEE